jgi:hypothetical protein
MFAYNYEISSNPRQMTARAEKNAVATIADLAAALVANFPSHFSIFCGDCWTEARVSQDAKKGWSYPRARSDVAKHFYSVGSRFHQKSLCPECAAQAEPSDTSGPPAI